MRISCPPTISPCFYGVDTPNRSELIAATHTLEEIREFIEADSLAYLSLDGLLRAVGARRRARTARRATPASIRSRSRATSRRTCSSRSRSSSDAGGGALRDGRARRSAGAAGAAAQAQRGQPPAARQTSPAQLKAAIDNLGKFDAPTRTAAARAVRRAPAAQAVPALIDAAAGHADGYVRFRALVLLSGFNDPRAREVMSASLDDPNDRLRTVAYAYFEHNQERGMAARLLKLLEKEDGEFVRPALTRALAALRRRSRRADGAERARPARAGFVSAAPSSRRWATIAPRTRSRRSWTWRSSTVRCRRTRSWRMGKIGDKRALEVLQELQKSAPRVRQPAVAAAICLLGINCASHQKFVVDTMTFAIDEPRASRICCAPRRGRSATLAAAGREDAATAICSTSAIPARDPARSPVALAFGTVALRNTPLAVKLLGRAPDVRDAALAPARRVRHARGGLRGRAFLRHRAPHLLAAPAGSRRPQGRRRADPGAGVLSGERSGSESPRNEMDYKQSGVDIDAGNEVVRRIKGLARSDLHARRALGARLVRRPLPPGLAALRDPVLVSSADGVGTKLRVAFMSGIHDTIGVDLVNHCVNDILVQGARAAVLPRLSGDRAARSRRRGADRRRAGARAAARTAARCSAARPPRCPASTPTANTTSPASSSAPSSASG